jgi:class 3 adenylate cyclase/tetratricopeptide (TPR) repeat protein
MTEERRLVTVLFADVTGSTAMGEALDPEDMRALLARYFAIAREVVTDHGGTIEKFIGDAVMAVFGLPTAHDDDASRAAASALALRDRVRADPRLGEQFPIRLGLSTGEVVASMDQEAGDFLVTGDTVNVAARLQQAAVRWEILCSFRTAHAASDGFAFGPQVEVEARGKGSPVIARRLEGITPGRSRVRLPFLGRDADLAQLELTAGRSFREKRPYLITITAPAGTGKTRLLEEFLQQLRGQEPDVRVLTAQCLPYGHQLTYLPLQTLLRTLLELPGDAEVERIRSAAEEWLAKAGDVNPRRTAELLAATFGAAERDPIDRGELFAAWRATVELVAREHPLVMVVEDLHWSSDSLLDLIEVVLQPRGDAPLLMIVLARPELLDRRPTWGGGRRNYVSLALEPLDDLAISALVDFMLHAPPPEVVEAVVARAEGNPFYAGELGRSISERVADLTDPAAVNALLATLPDTVHATVLARLDLLPPVPRRVLQLGSVFGRSFVTAGITALAAEADHEAVGEAIDHLLEHDLIRPMEGDAYVFRHILIRDVGYQTLPRGERARLHATAGRWLEDRAVGREEEQAELVAFHYREAISLGTAAGAETDPALLDRAVMWLRRASDTAIAGAAFEEASRHIRAALEIAPREQLPDLWVASGDIFGGGAQAADAYVNATRLGRELGRPPDFILRALSGQMMVIGRWGGSVGGEVSASDLFALLEDIRAVREAASDRRTIGYSLVAEAFLPAISGDFTHTSPADLWGSRTLTDLDAAEALAERAAAIARELDDPVLLSAALDAQGAALLGRDPVAGQEVARQRLAIEDRLPLAERTDVHNMLAWNDSALGNLDAVLLDVDGILRDLAPNQAMALALSMAAWKVWSLALLGRWDEVPAAAERSNQLWEDSGRISAGFALHGYMAALEVGWARGDERLASRARAVLLGIVEHFPHGQLFQRLSAFAGPDLEALVQTVILDWRPYITRFHLVERVVSMCADHHQPIPIAGLTELLSEADARGQRLLATQLRRARGVQEGSVGDLRQALEEFRGYGARPFVARVESELGFVIGDQTLVSSGMAGLEALGDIAQLGRVARVAR